MFYSTAGDVPVIVTTPAGLQYVLDKVRSFVLNLRKSLLNIQSTIEQRWPLEHALFMAICDELFTVTRIDTDRIFIGLYTHSSHSRRDWLPNTAKRSKCSGEPCSDRRCIPWIVNRKHGPLRCGKCIYRLKARRQSFD